MDTKDMLTTQQAADLRRVHQQLILRWCQHGLIECTKIGEGRRKIWLINKQSLMDYQAPRKGRPRKQKDESDVK